MPEQYNWYYDRQKRIGARVAIVCSRDIGGREVGAVSVHLENRADSEAAKRRWQSYDEIKRSFAPDTPVMIGGDLNTNTFDGNDIPGFTKLFNDPERLSKHMEHVECTRARSAAGGGKRLLLPRVQQHRGTRRKPMPGGKSMLLKLDWLMARGMECVSITARFRPRRRTAPGPAGRAGSSQVPAVRPQRLLGRLSIHKVNTEIY